MKKLVVLTGSGISAESGIQTFRGSDKSYWNNNNITDIATLDAWKHNREHVTKFYNERREHLSAVKPNLAHKFLTSLEEFYDVTVVTQNVDDLHERAGSSNIIHLHGELTKARHEESGEIVSIGYAQMDSDKPYRPHVVWFGEQPFNYSLAAKSVHSADVLLVIGTSLYVATAVELLRNIKSTTELYVVDPGENPLLRKIQMGIDVELYLCGNLRNHKHTFIQKSAVDSVEELSNILI